MTSVCLRQLEAGRALGRVAPERWEILVSRGRPPLPPPLCRPRHFPQTRLKAVSFTFTPDENHARTRVGHTNTLSVSSKRPEPSTMVRAWDLDVVLPGSRHPRSAFSSWPSAGSSGLGVVSEPDDAPDRSFQGATLPETTPPFLAQDLTRSTLPFLLSRRDSSSRACCCQPWWSS